MDDKDQITNTSSKPGYDKSDPNITRLVVIGLIFVALVVVALVVVNELFIYTKERDIQNTVLKPESVAIRDLRAHEDEVLSSFKVLDDSNGVYQIPIDRAMDLVVKEAAIKQTKPQGNHK
jgi:hypothetical protein